MTDKEFRRLKRSQLIDIIYHLEKEIEEEDDRRPAKAAGRPDDPDTECGFYRKCGTGTEPTT